MVNAGLREACADILLALVDGAEPRRAGHLLRGARMLRHAERLEYGNPNDRADDIAELETALDEAEHEIDELREIVAPMKLVRHDARKAKGKS